jgi:peptide deformylase
LALLKIARIGHPVLRQKAEPVPDPAAPEIRRLVADMAETMLDAGGIGLAAPQVHLPLRLFVWRDSDGVRALINPEITPIHEAEETSWEGCLSIPGLRGPVTRPASVLYRGFDERGEPVEGEATGLAARVLQHENDHLDGIIYLMRMNDLSMLGFQEELARAAERSA